MNIPACQGQRSEGFRAKGAERMRTLTSLGARCGKIKIIPHRAPWNYGCNSNY